MSAEVAKKPRGRPRKVVVEAVEIEVPEAVKKTTTTRAKSTKAAAPTPAKPKAVKVAKTTTTPVIPRSTTSAKASIKTAAKSAASNVELEEKAKEAAKKAISKIQAKASASPKNTKAEKVVAKPQAAPVSSKLVPKPAAKAPIAPIPSAGTSPIPKPALADAASKTTWQASKSPVPLAASKAPIPDTPGSSKILSKVRELSQKNASPPPQSIPPTSPKSTPPPKPVSKSPTTTPQALHPMLTETPKHIPAGSKPTPTPKVPIAAINKEIVSNITARAGARPGGSNNLPPNYKSAARRVTMAIVAMPIAIVTSYVLYQRLVLKEEQKSLVPPVPGRVGEKQIVLSTTPPVEKTLE